MDKSDESLYYTVRDLMTIFQISKANAYKLTQVSGFPTMRIGSKILIEKEGLSKWRKNHLYKTVDYE